MPKSANTWDGSEQDVRALFAPATDGAIVWLTPNFEAKWKRQFASNPFIMLWFCLESRHVIEVVRPYG